MDLHRTCRPSIPQHQIDIVSGLLVIDRVWTARELSVKFVSSSSGVAHTEEMAHLRALRCWHQQTTPCQRHPIASRHLAKGPAKDHAIQKSKEATPDVIRYSSTPADDNMGGNFNPPAKFGSWGQLLSSSGKRQYSSLQPSNPQPPTSAAMSTLPRVAGQRRQQQLYPAGLSSESESSGASPSSSDEDGDEDEEDDEEDNDVENHSDATTCTGSEMALAASKNEQQKEKSKNKSSMRAVMK
ncbi:hypothetical protein AVEN_150613-1 [Araneus ventricosus]|uniref:Uncharacterized protein n=1 Tax=Araneus ventricosus TaxID=182803 RepID=A0A4Y2GNW3_ARAVE|nr:hypothetical protein AVEN_150613-1 [Araneus ventricosus]